jgi:glycosyltransferase involved in cell wall biosynthesis
MHLAIVSEAFAHTNGITRRLKETLPLLAQAGDEILLLVPGETGTVSREQGMTVCELPSVSLPLYPDFRVGLPFSSRALALLTDFRPDLVHVVNPVSAGLLGIWYARTHHVPLIASYHTHLPIYLQYYKLGCFEPLAWAYLRLLHNQARLNLCPSTPVQSMLETHTFNNVHLWRSGVDTALFDPQKRSQEWRDRLSGGHPEKTLLLYVGRLAREKRLDWLVTLSQRLPDCHVAFVGEGPAAEELQQQARGLPVSFPGPLYGEELASAYASADCFAFPSRTDTFGNAVLEAMAAGLPVCAVRNGGSQDMVIDGETGVLFDSDSIDDFQRALTYLITHPAERMHMAQLTRQRALQWSWRQATNDLRADYQRILAEATGVSAQPQQQHLSGKKEKSYNEIATTSM